MRYRGSVLDRGEIQRYIGYGKTSLEQGFASTFPAKPVLGFTRNAGVARQLIHCGALGSVSADNIDNALEDWVVVYLALRAS